MTLLLKDLLHIHFLLLLCIVGHTNNASNLKGDLGDEEDQTFERFEDDIDERVEDEIDEEDIPSVEPTQAETQTEVDMDKIISVDPRTTARTPPPTTTTPGTTQPHKGTKQKAFHFCQKVTKLEMLGSIVSRLGSVNPQHVCSLCKFIFTCL